jgi:predicted acylesterase/phospholipase RssA
MDVQDNEKKAENEDNEDNEVDSEEPVHKITIKHLVVAGGGTYGLKAYGSLQETQKQGLWSVNDLQSCHATSIGVVICIMIFLQYEWKELDDYIIKRPWHHLFHYDIYSILNSFNTNGFYDISTFKQLFRPLFKGMDISEDITLLEFYEKTNIDFHIYTTSVNAFDAVDLSHKTHPNWTLLEAAYASGCIPIFFKPFEKDGEFYIDGGVFLNYPVEKCLDLYPHEEILGIYKITDEPEKMKSSSNLLEYIGILFGQVSYRIQREDCSIIPYEIKIDSPSINIGEIFEFCKSETCRAEWAEIGRVLAKNHIEKWTDCSKSELL